MSTFINYTIDTQKLERISETIDMQRDLMRNVCEKALDATPYPDDVFLQASPQLLNLLWDTGRLYCNGTFDDWLCWNHTLAGTRSYTKCPKFLEPAYGKPPPNARAFKDCKPDGLWWVHPTSGEAWTNYTECLGSHEALQRVIYVYYSGYGLSIVFLILSLVVFIHFRQLQCNRITIHKHLFVTYIVSGTAWISLYTLFDNPDTLLSNPMWCQGLHVLTQYLTLCNYAWMFCEGLYLHILIVLTFTNEQTLLYACYVIGWAVPAIPTAVYSGVRGSYPNLTKSCWTGDTKLKWILTGPVALSLIINFIFLVNILRVLLSKLRAVNSSEDHQVRRTVRAALILIPLLGLQYLVIPFIPDKASSNAHIYDIISAILTSFQGVFVAFLFCLLNGEVLSLLRRKCKREEELYLRQTIPQVSICEEYQTKDKLCQV